jgi:glutamate-1-semialdehyde aminotransferase
MADRLTLTRGEAAFEEAKRLVPGGVLGIRRPMNFVPGEYPLFLESGKGGYAWDPDGNRFIDMICAYGPIILGHREDEVDDAVIAHIKGRGFCFTLAQELQTTLVRRLTELIPCAEMGFPVKTGSDATLAAIRIARGATGRPKILRCGYHGWHDWCVEVKTGIPSKLYEDVFEFHYNDLDGLEALLKQHAGEVAGIIVTPVGHPLAHPVQAPAPGYLEGVRELATRHGAVLIFDEIRSGFRVALGGAQQRYGVTPDLATFGKALANGYAISAVVGRREFLSVVESKVFVSSTFFPNSLEIVAALKTLEILQREHVLDDIWAKGERLLAGWRRAVESAPVPAQVSGIPPMPFVTFESRPDGRHKAWRQAFYTGMIRRGVFLAPYHHGYVCWRHSDADVEYVIGAMEESLRECAGLPAL